MPFYEYQCKQCSHLFEAMQKISEAPLKKCPACGKNALRKLISAPVFRLKGSGWYETDFKSDQEKKRNLADAEPAGSSGADKAEKADKPKSEAAAGNAEAKPAAADSSESSAKPAAAATTGESSGTSSGGKRRSSGGAPARGSSRPSPARPAKRAAPAKRAKSKPRRSSVRGRR
jgi:putative FmdB family regulatory protein